MYGTGRHRSCVRCANLGSMAILRSFWLGRGGAKVLVKDMSALMPDALAMKFRKSRLKSHRSS